MSGDQTKELDVVVSAYRIYQRMMEVGTRRLQSLAFRQYRTEAVEYHKAEKLANVVIHQHMDRE